LAPPKHGALQLLLAQLFSIVSPGSPFMNASTALGHAE
jgi:hypothetical protein